MIKLPIIASLLAAVPLIAAPLSVTNLRTEHEVNPIGIGSKPRLSWWLIAEDNERGKRQTAFHILAASSLEKLAQNEGDLWDHKNEKNAQNHLIEWAGQKLKDGTTVHWKVKVWDEKKKEGPWSPVATFKVGGQRQLQPITSSSSFECSNETLNKIFQVHKDALGNRLNQFVAGDPSALGMGLNVQSAVREYLYNFRSSAALWHWVDLLNQQQNQVNLYPSSPGSKLSGLGNSDAGILVPHGTWWMSGDTARIKTIWKNMDNYMVSREQADQGFRGRIWGLAIGDYSPAGPYTPREFLDICYLGLTSRIMKDLALPGGTPLTAIRYKDFTSRIRKSFARQYLKDDGTLTLSSQTAHLLAIRANVLPKEQRGPLLDSLKKSLLSEGLQAGPVGAQALFPVLTFTGNLDLAFDLITKPTQRDWTSPKSLLIGTGATEWMMSALAGIDSSSPGFRQIRINPQIPSDKRLTHVKARHDAPTGVISSAWEKTDDSFTLACSIPPGTLAIINIPFTPGQTLSESGKSLKEAFGLQLVKKDAAAGVAQILIQSGSYEIKAESPSESK